MSNVKTVAKQLIVEEDLLYGEGLTTQRRQSLDYRVTKIRHFRPVNSLSEMSELDPEKFPKVALFDNSGVSFYMYVGENYVLQQVSSPASAANLPLLADETAAVQADLAQFSMYRTATGEVRYKL